MRWKKSITYNLDVFEEIFLYIQIDGWEYQTECLKKERLSEKNKKINSKWMQKIIPILE